MEKKWKTEEKKFLQTNKQRLGEQKEREEVEKIENCDAVYKCIPVSPWSPTRYSAKFVTKTGGSMPV